MLTIMSTAMLGILLLCSYLTTSEATVDSAPIQVVNLRTEYLKNPLGLDVEAPRFSWQLQVNQQHSSLHSLDSAQSIRGVHQESYQIVVTEEGSETPFWDSGVVSTAAAAVAPVNVAYSGPKLKTGGVYSWDVRTVVSSLPSSGLYLARTIRLLKRLPASSCFLACMLVILVSK